MNGLSLYNAVKLYIEERPAEEIGTLKPGHLARKFNVSLSFLSRSFSKHNFFTLHQYLELFIFIRFDSIARGLKKPNVKEALEIMNIKDTSYFIRRYKKRFKRTPGQYCKMCRERNKRYAREYRVRRKKRGQK
jgi:AraC-like DNA-binding protein